MRSNGQIFLGDKDLEFNKVLPVVFIRETKYSISEKSVYTYTPVWTLGKLFKFSGPLLLICKKEVII